MAVSTPPARRRRGAREVVLIGRCNTGAQVGVRAPAELGEGRDVEELLRGSVRTTGIEAEGSREADDLTDQLRQLANGEIAAHPDIDVGLGGIVREEEDEGVGKVVDM